MKPADFEAMDAALVREGTVVGPGPRVQGTVVQGTVVAHWHRWGVGQSQPMQSMPPMPPVQQDMVARPEDIEGAQSGWLLYSIGWLLCCCVGPLGPIFWLVVACRYYRKHEEERKQLPKQHRVASISLVTAIVTVAVICLSFVMLIVLAGSPDERRVASIGLVTAIVTTSVWSVLLLSIYSPRSATRGSSPLDP